MLTALWYCHYSGSLLREVCSVLESVWQQMGWHGHLLLTSLCLGSKLALNWSGHCKATMEPNLPTADMITCRKRSKFAFQINGMVTVFVFGCRLTTQTRGGWKQ